MNEIKNLRQTILIVFAALGFITLISAFDTPPNNSSDQEVWDLEASSNGSQVFMWNKVTGEIRKITTNALNKSGVYVTLKEGDTNTDDKKTISVLKGKKKDKND
tara:strand:- start:250 stop:561 length:312 start_codon:yes stop_codon:yes gene_type:complete